MPNRSKRETAATRAYQSAHSGASYTAALFAIRAQHVPTAPAPQPARVIDPSRYLGCQVELSAPGRRTQRGVVIPAAARSRTGRLRLALDGRAPRRFEPDGYEIRVLAGPDYVYRTLPAEHLATATMLRTELRRRPADDQPAIATYQVTARGRRGSFPLYAVADTVELAALAGKRAEAWTAARTCGRCGAGFARPLPTGPLGTRSCEPCHEAVAAERWVQQSRGAQQDAAAWAHDALTDPAVLLIAWDGAWNPGGLRAETVAGEVVADAVVREIEDPQGRTFVPPKTPEQIRQWAARFDGTIPPSQFRAQAERIAGSRPLMWWAGYAGVPVLSMIHDLPSKGIADGDQVGSRLALWGGRSGHRTGSWYPEPKTRWSWTLLPPELKRFAAALHAAHKDPALAIALMREALRLMATAGPPQPAVSGPAAAD